MTYETIPGWMAPEFEAFYEAIADRLDSRARIVEVGAAYGRSIAFLCEAFAMRGEMPTIYAVDLWQEFMGGEQADKAEFVACMKKNHRDPLDAFIAQLREFSPIAYRNVIVMPGASVARAKAFDNCSLDFVMIDARHEYENVKADITAWLPKVKGGGILAGDDYDLKMFPGLVRAVQEFQQTGAYIEHTGRIWAYEVPA